MSTDYNALRTMPDGALRPSILQNGRKTEDAENVIENSRAYHHFLAQLLNMALSVFEWDGLPEGIDSRMLEYWLLYNGYCAFFYDEDLKYATRAGNNAPEGYAVLQCMYNGELGMYNLPDRAVAYAVNGMNVPLNEDNSVLMFDNMLRYSIVPDLEWYAYKIADIERTIDVNMRAQKTPYILQVNEKKRLSFKNLAKQIMGNVYSIEVSDKLGITDAITPIPTLAPFISDKAEIVKHALWAEAMTFIGIESAHSDKKAQVTQGEVTFNLADTEVMRNTRLKARQQAADKINERFGLDVSVKFSSGIYIHTVEDKNANGIPDEMEQEGGEDE